MKKISFLLVIILIFTCTGCAKNAERAEEHNFVIEGERYIAISIGYTEEGKKYAKTDGFDIMEIPEDKTHTFLAVRSALDNWTIVKESYVVPTSGELNVGYCNHERITDGEKHNMIQSILDGDFQNTFVIRTTAEADIHNATKDIYVGYEDCPVGTDWIGVIGNINGKLVFIRADDIKDGDLQYTCNILNSAYQDLYSDSVEGTFETVE